MIAAPAGWTSARHGAAHVYVSPDGPGAASLRYVERLRPLRRATALLAAAGRPAGFEATATSAPIRLATDEGEHAALIVIDGRLAGGPAQLTFGVVALDDHYARLQGLAFGEHIAATRALVEALLRGDRHFLGAVRRRRVVYTPPPGWQGVGDTFTATWFPRDYPRRDQRIYLGPAMPLSQEMVAGTIAAIVGGPAPLEQQVVVESGPAAHPHLGGERVVLRLPGLETETHVALLADSRFQYLARLDCLPAERQEALPLFDAVVASVEPVPAMAAATPPAGAAEVNATGQWAE
jgi:hypothetical protein